MVRVAPSLSSGSLRSSLSRHSSASSTSSSARTLIVTLVLSAVLVVALFDDYHVQAPSSIENSGVLTKTSMKAPLPIFDASLFKSGTTTAHQYFLCGGQRSIHHGYPYPWPKLVPARFKKLGFFIRDNIRHFRPAFTGLGYDVFHEPGIQEGGDMCWHPSVHALEEIYQSYPNSTFLQITRPAEKWVRSLKRYKMGALMRRVGSCSAPNFPKDLYGSDLTDEDYAAFYTQQVERVRNFASAHPSLNYIEVALEDPDIGKILEERTGIDAACWGHANGTPPKYKWWYWAS